MSHSNLITAYNKLKTSYGCEYSPDAVKQAIYLVNYQLLNQSAELETEVSLETASALHQLHHVYCFFDDLGKFTGDQELTEPDA